MSRVLHGLVTLAIAVGANAQVVPERAIVATDVGGATVLVDVDLATGAQTVFGRFSDDVWPPLAVAQDAVDDRAIVAVDLGGGQSRIVRVGRAARPFERVLADVSGTVTGLSFSSRGDVIATVGGSGGGIVIVPRPGGAPSTALALPHAAASFAYERSDYAFVVADPPGAGALAVGVDLSTGTLFQGPTAIPTPGGATVTGVADLPTGALRQVLSDSGGGLALFEFGAVLTPIPVQPPWPGGGIRALDLVAGVSIDVAVLGDGTHPWLDRVVVFGGTLGARTPLAGPFPGAPVDFSIATPSAARLLTFGDSCSTAAWSPRLGSTGWPNLGAALFLEVRAAEPATLAIAAIGFDEQRWPLGPLPFVLPGGCSLLVDPAVGLGAVTDAAGFATVSLSVPNDSRLIGFGAYSQWIVGAALASSEAAAIRIGL